MVEFEQEDGSKRLHNNPRDVTEGEGERGAFSKNKEFRYVLEKSNDCMILLDVDGRILDINRKSVEVYGGSREELIGKHFTKLGLFHPRDMPKLLSNFTRIIAGRESTLDICFKNKKGQEIHLECSGSLTREDEGPAHILVIARDITERKKAEKALRESEEKYGALVENSPNGIFISNADKFIYVNRCLCEITGFSREELLNMPDPVGSLFTPEERDRVLGYARSRLNGGPAPTCYEARGIRKDGEDIFLKLTVSSITLSGKRVLQGNVEDITERKRTEEALNSERDKLQALMDGLARTEIGIDVVGIDYRVLFQNEILEERFGDLSGKLCYEVYMGLKEPCDFCPMIKAIRSKKVESVELTRADGRNYELLSAPLPNPDGTVEKAIEVVKDITERKQTEEALRKSEERLRTIISNAPIVMWALDKEGIFTLSEGMGLRALGLGPGEIVGRSVFEVYHDVPKILEYNRRALAGESFVSTVEVGELTFESHYSPIQDEDGEVIGMIGVSTDITERKKAEDALAQERNLLRTLIDSMPDYIFAKDVESRFITTNAAHLQTLGSRRVEDVIGKTDFDFFPRELAERYYIDEQSIIESGQSILSREEEVIDQTGTTKWFSTIKVPLRDTRGSVIGIVGVSRDITERRRAEQELMRLSNAVRMSTDSIVISNLKGKITNVNDATLRMYGTNDGKDLIGRESLDLIAPEDREEALAGIRETLEKGYVKGREYHVITKDGTRIPVEMNSAIMKDANGEPVGFVAITRDITERKRAEEELRRYSEHLEELVEERTRDLKIAERMATIGETTTMVGHDLRNPLQAIVNNIYMAKKKAASLHIPEDEIKVKQALQKSLETIGERVGYMNKIVLDLQDYSRPVKPKLYGTDMEKLVSDVLSTVTIPETVKVSTMTDGDFPELMIDRELMRRVLTNLITNAVQAMPEGGKLMIRLSAKNRDALISIQDTGVGIPEENLDKLFNPLFTTKSQGQGFGLPVCKRLIEAHGGSISVDSEEEKGSTFTVKIPVEPSGI